jgi:hypothetical protein
MRHERLPPKILYFNFYRNTVGGAPRASDSLPTFFSTFFVLSKIIMNNHNNNILILIII